MLTLTQRQTDSGNVRTMMTKDKAWRHHPQQLCIGPVDSG